MEREQQERDNRFRALVKVHHAVGRERQERDIKLRIPCRTRRPNQSRSVFTIKFRFVHLLAQSVPVDALHGGFAGEGGERLEHLQGQKREAQRVVAGEGSLPEVRGAVFDFLVASDSQHRARKSKDLTQTIAAQSEKSNRRPTGVTSTPPSGRSCARTCSYVPTVGL